MIKKERLVAGLNELLYVEEGMVTLFLNFSKVLLKHAGDIEEGKKKKIDKLLSVLYHDSERHKEMLDDLTKEVRKSVRDEY